MALAMTVAWALAPARGAEAQDAPPTAAPADAAVFAALEGDWEGTGKLLGRLAAFTMRWEATGDGFVRLSFTNAWVGEDGALTPVLAAEATYRVSGALAVGVWVDSRPQRLTIEAVLTDSSVVSEWTAPAEEGRTEYLVRSPEGIHVRDFVYTDDGERLFAEATYRRRRAPDG